MAPRMTPEEADALLATMTDEDFPTAPPEMQLTDDEEARYLEAIDRVVGRPSLTGPGQQSPNFTIRLPQVMKDRLAAVAAMQHRRESEVAREALGRYLETVG